MGQPPARPQLVANLCHQGLLVRHVVDRIAVHHRVHLFPHGIGELLYFGLDKLDCGVSAVAQLCDGGSQSGGGVVHGINDRVACGLESLQDEFCHAPGAASEVHDAALVANLRYVQQAGVNRPVEWHCGKRTERMIISGGQP